MCGGSSDRRRVLPNEEIRYLDALEIHRCALAGARFSSGVTVHLNTSNACQAL